MYCKYGYLSLTQYEQGISGGSCAMRGQVRLGMD